MTLLLCHLRYHIKHKTTLHCFVYNLVYNEPMNTFEDIFEFYAVGNCIKLFLWAHFKSRNSQHLSVNFFLKHPVAKTGFQQARSNTGLNVFKDDLTVWILPNHPNMVLYHNMLIVSIFKIERVDHFLVEWLLECSAPSAGCHHRPDTTPRQYEAGRYKDEVGIRTYISS